MKRNSSLIIISIICISFWFCQKKIFGKIEVKGRLIHFFTKQPIQKTVSLYANDATSSKSITRGTIGLASTESNGDGTFYLKSKPSKTGSYYLKIEDHNRNLPFSINADPKINNDVGDILLGEQTFYCRINVISSSNSSITFFSYGYSEATVSFNSGTTTQFLHYIKYTNENYEKNNRNYSIHYFTDNGVKTYTSINLPITNDDTLHTTITY